MTKRLSSILATLTVGAAALGVVAPAQAEAASAGRSPAEQALLTAVNEARADAGLPGLRPLWVLARPARAHSIHMSRTDSLDHDGADGRPFWVRLVAAGFPRNRWMGENLAMAPGCDLAAAREVVQLWLDSPGHRANLLSQRFRHLGTGVASNGPDCAMTAFTADFGG